MSTREGEAAGPAGPTCGMGAHVRNGRPREASTGPWTSARIWPDDLPENGWGARVSIVSHGWSGDLGGSCDRTAGSRRPCPTVPSCVARTTWNDWARQAGPSDPETRLAPNRNVSPRPRCSSDPACFTPHNSATLDRSPPACLTPHDWVTWRGRLQPSLSWGPSTIERPPELAQRIWLPASSSNSGYPSVRGRSPGSRPRAAATRASAPRRAPSG
jgi:hypothetical protein